VSDELNELERRLTAATEPECPGHLLSDAETAALREGWLALGELLDAAQPALDQPVRLPEPPTRWMSARWKLAAAAALAVTVLLGVTLAWQFVGGNRGGDIASPTEGGEGPNAPWEPSFTMPTEEELVWDDPLDEQIALAGEQIVRLQQDWDYLDDAFGPVYSGLEEMEDDLDESTL
jgi:hypothetical protein